MSRRRLVATLGLAASGLACAPAVNYLDPSGPLYSTPARETAAAPTAGPAPPCRQLQHRVRDRDRPRDRGAARDRGPPRPGLPGPPGDGRPGHRADRESARDERGLLPERSPPEARAGLRVRDPVALAARGAAKDPAAARRPGLGPAALGGLGRGRPWGAADPRLLAAPAFAPGHLGRLAQGGAAGDRRGRGLGGRAGRHRWRLQLPRQGRGAREGRLPLGHQGPGRHGAAGRPRDRAGRPRLRPRADEGPPAGAGPGRHGHRAGQPRRERPQADLGDPASPAH